MSPPIRAWLLLVTLVVPLAACGGEGESDGKRPEPEFDCFTHEASGTYEIDLRFSEIEAAMRQLAAECEEAGCIKRETAICRFEQERDRSGYGKGTPGAQVVRSHSSSEDPILVWRVWSELPPEDQFAGETEYTCSLDAMDGSRVLCGAVKRR